MLVTEDMFSPVLERIQNEGRVAFDSETSGLNLFGRDRMVGISILTPSDSQSYYFAFRHGQGYNLPTDLMRPLVMALSMQTLTGWNTRFDLKMLRKEYLNLGLNVYPHKIEDCMLAAHLLNENEPNFKLKDTADRYAKYLGYTDRLPSADQQDLDLYLMEHGLSHGDMWRAPSEVVAPYAEADVALTEKLRTMYLGALHRWQLYDLWQENNDYLVVIEKMEERGMCLDQARVQTLYDECLSEQQRCIQAIQDLSHIPNLNPNSTKLFKAYVNHQLSTIHNVAPIVSTDAPTLEALLDEVPENSVLYQVLELAIKYRQWVKIGSTYYAAFQKNAYQGVIHPNLNQIGTVTGRFSSGDPINMQSIPRHDESNAGKPAYRVKESFVARPGYQLVEVDYRMAELYLISHFAKATTMAQMLLEGRDVHAETAILMGGIPRAVAKRINFSIAYGIGIDAFVADIKKMAGLIISRRQAALYLDEHRKIHPELPKLYHDMEQEAKDKKHIRLISGRVRHYNGSEFFGKDGEKGSPYHKASSNLIQGNVGQIMQLVSMRIQQELEGQVWQLLHVHDSMLFEIPDSRDDLVERIKNIMEVDCAYGVELTVPMKVDVKVGYRWSDLQKWVRS